MNVRQRYGLNIIALKRGEEVTVNITPQTVLRHRIFWQWWADTIEVNRFENDLQNWKTKKA